MNRPGFRKDKEQRPSCIEKWTAESGRAEVGKGCSEGRQTGGQTDRLTDGQAGRKDISDRRDKQDIQAKMNVDIDISLYGWIGHPPWAGQRCSSASLCEVNNFAKIGFARTLAFHSAAAAVEIDFDKNGVGKCNVPRL